MILIFTSLFFLQTADSLLCHQCEGWRGYRQSSNQEDSCFRYNSNCETNLFCVKITEPMTKQSTYEPYRSECWHQDTLVIGPGNSTIIENRCYSFSDQSSPPKRWTYCFCNNRDYCNSSVLNSIFLAFCINFINKFF